MTPLTQAIPQGDGADRAFGFMSLTGPSDEHDAARRTFTQVGDLLRAIDRKVLRDVLPAWSRVTALVGVRVVAEDWTGGRVRFIETADRDKAWARLSGLVALALANAESLDARIHWRLASSFIRYLALLEYQNAVTSLNHQRELALTVEQTTALTSDVMVFGSYAGVLS